MSSIGRQFSTVPRAALPHQKIAQRRDGSTNKCVGTQLAPTATSRQERGADKSIKHAPINKTNTTCPPLAMRARRRLARGSKKLAASTVNRVLRQLSQDGHRAPPKHRQPSKINHPPNITVTISRHTKSDQQRLQYNFWTCQITSKARHHRITYLEVGKEGQESRQITNKGEVGHHRMRWQICTGATTEGADRQEADGEQ